MSPFDVVRFTFRAIPLLAVPGLLVALRRASRFSRYATVVLIGWVVLVVCTNLFWSLSIEYAPNEAIREDLSSRDGGPRAFVLVFGWGYVAAYAALFEGARALYVSLTARLRRAGAA
jgi:hypothetical protein